MEKSVGQRVRRGLAWSSVNTVLVRMGNLALGVALARMLAPEKFGVYAVALTVHAVLVSLADLGVSADIIRRGDVARRGPTVATLGLVAGCTTSLIMVASANIVARSMGAPEASSVVQVMGLALIVSGMGVVPGAVMQREFLQGQQFICDLVGLATMAGLALGLVNLGVGPMSLAIARVVSQAAVTGLQFRFSRWHPALGWDADVAGDAMRFGVPIAVANLLSWAVITVDNMLVGHLTGLVNLGLYVMAFNLCSWPINIIGTIVRSVALPGFSRLSDDPDDAARALTQGAGLTWILATPLAVVMSILSAPLVLFLYGPDWKGASAPLIGLALFGALRVLFDVFAAFLYSRGASRVVLWIQVVWLVTLFPALLMSIQRWGLLGAGWSHLVVGLVVVLPAYLLAIMREQTTLVKLLAVISVGVVAAVPAAGALHVTGAWTGSSSLLQLLFGGSSFGVVYALIVILAGRIWGRSLGMPVGVRAKRTESAV